MQDRKFFDVPDVLDVLIVGAGFAGMYALQKFRSLGFSVRVIEAGSDVGGTWYWNRYPGARCDVHSMEYSYQFSDSLQQQWSWSEKYAAQPEILAYANYVAERFDLRKDIQFLTRIEKMVFDQENNFWRSSTNTEEEIHSRFCIMATGCLSKPNIPAIEGLNDFKGNLLHTAAWPKQEVDFSNKRVGIIGTGSSAIQTIPLVAELAESLAIFQRTASFSIPARNAPLDKSYEREIKLRYKEFRNENSQRYAALNNNPNFESALEADDDTRNSVYEDRWQLGGLPFLASFNDLATNLEANRTAAEFVHGKIREIVKNTDTATRLCPQTVFGCKRLCVDSNYYQTYNKDNVHLVDLNSSPIERITESGIRTRESDYDLDCLILATGFDAMTGALLNIDIRGVDQLSLSDKWCHGPQNYLGLSINGFPNFFMITGPGSPSVLANMIVAIEQHVDWIADCLQYLRKRSLTVIEACSTAESNWVKRVNRIAAKTLYPNGCNSWYTGANIPGKTKIFMPYLGYPNYVDYCESVASKNYSGFTLH